MSENVSDPSEDTPGASGASFERAQSREAATQPQKPTESEAPPAQNTAAGGRWNVFWVIAIIGVVASIALAHLISAMPAPARTFVALGVCAGALIVGGLVFLIILIPAAGSNPDVKTEFYSARAAYNCVIAGLIAFLIVAIGAIVASVTPVMRRH
jgi:hypothetical protein